jgi:hypothetical protein
VFTMLQPYAQTPLHRTSPLLLLSCQVPRVHQTPASCSMLTANNLRALVTSHFCLLGAQQHAAPQHVPASTQPTAAPAAASAKLQQLYPATMLAKPLVTGVSHAG